MKKNPLQMTIHKMLRQSAGKRDGLDLAADRLSKKILKKLRR